MWWKETQVKGLGQKVLKFIAATAVYIVFCNRLNVSKT